MPHNTRLINDTIYKHIECSGVENQVLQTKIVNRLLFVTQNALAYFAYPSINTKRYIHSLGTMHLSAHLFKNSLVNTTEHSRNQCIKTLRDSIKKIIHTHGIDIDLKNSELFDSTSLYEFTIPLKSKKAINIYLITLQALRLAGLLHDVGHFPFSHQVEYALKKLYKELRTKQTHSHKEQEFLEFYQKITKNSSLVLHEAIGTKLVRFLFEYELFEDTNTLAQKEYYRLLYHLLMHIFEEKHDGIFDYGVLHRYIDGTIDADRLDYINRDMLASGYISGATDFIRITKHAILLEKSSGFELCFLEKELLDIEQMLEMRFNLYKKIIFSHKIAITDALLENVILYLARRYFKEGSSYQDNISMLWTFLSEPNLQKRLDTISKLDENWLITLFKQEYFDIKYKKSQNREDIKYLVAFEEVLFGKKFYKSLWKNLHELYNLLGFDTKQRYHFRESFGYVSPRRYERLEEALQELCHRYEDKEQGIYLSYRIVSLNIGIDKGFTLFDGKEQIQIDEISTVRKRLKKSIQNSVPFYLYCNSIDLLPTIKEDIQKILYDIFL